LFFSSKGVGVQNVLCSSVGGSFSCHIEFPKRAQPWENLCDNALDSATNGPMLRRSARFSCVAMSSPLLHLSVAAGAVRQFACASDGPVTLKDQMSLPNSQPRDPGE
jgi:hypothetical protein